MITIKIEYFLKHNSKFCRFLSIKMLTLLELPKLYLSLYPHCYRVTDSIKIVESQNSKFQVFTNVDYPKIQYERIILLLNLCGNHLKNVNDNIRRDKQKEKEKELWEGTRIIKI